MIRPLAFVWPLWRFITKTWIDRKPRDRLPHRLRPSNSRPNPDQESDCPISVYTEAIPAPNNVAAYLARGTAHLKASAFDRAINDFTKAIKLRPNNDSAYAGRGTAYYEKTEFDRPIADFNKAIEMNPRSADAYCNLGWTYEAIGDERLAHYPKALELNPSLEAARDNLKLLDATPERTRFHRQPKPTNFKGS